MKTALIVICAIGGLLLVMGAVLIAFLAADLGYPLGVFQRTYFTAEYDQMEFGGEGSTVATFGTGVSDQMSIAAIFLKLPDNSIVFLPDLKASDFAAFASNEMRHSIPNGKEMVRYTISGSAFAAFVDDKLVSFSMGRGPSLQISPTKDGTFVGLPFSKEKMIEIFGRPKSYRYSHPKPV